MTANRLQRLEKTAFAKINSIAGTDEGRDNVDLFLNHHLEELEADDILACTNNANPSKTQLVKCLILRDAWASNDEDRVDTFDFTLPNDITNYVISVKFGENDIVSEISMES